MAKRRSVDRGSAGSAGPAGGALEPRVVELAAGLQEPVTAHEAAGLARYAELVRTWNARVNLTAARDDQSLCEVLLADALVLRAHALVGEGERVVDVGTGAGAPLLPLLLLRPDLRALSIEPLHKRAAFLRTAAARLGLSGRLQVSEARIDEAAPVVPTGPFDLACSRATFAPELWLRVGLQLAPAALVLTVAEHPAPLPPGAALVTERAYRLPSSGAPRRVARYERRD